jgi:hypothetical protein
LVTAGIYSLQASSIFLSQTASRKLTWKVLFGDGKNLLASGIQLLPNLDSFTEIDLKNSGW